MSARKKGKLSLKKSKSVADGQGSNNILSMFKRQKEKQLETGPAPKLSKDDMTNSLVTLEESSDSDVVITKVESICVRDSSIKISEKDVKRSENCRKKLSLTKMKRKKTLAVEESNPSESKYFHRDNSRLDLNEKFDLRKSKTEPILSTGISDSDEESNILNLESDTTKHSSESSQKENLLESKHSSGGSSVHQVKSSKAVGKLSLTKNKTQATATGKSVLEVKRNTEEFLIQSEAVCREINTTKHIEKKEHENLKFHKVPKRETQNLEKRQGNTLENKNMKELETVETANRHSGSCENKSNSGIIDVKVECESHCKSSPSIRGEQNAQMTTYSIFKSHKLGQSSETKQRVSMEIDDESDAESKADLLEKLEDNKSGTELYKVPYYLENFRTILDTVLGDKENFRLFNDNDMKYITAFNSLDEAAQKLYVRLFTRRLAWLPLSKINYPEITASMEGAIDTLVSVDLLVPGDELSDISQILPVMAAPDLKSLAKSFHLNITSVTKKQMIEMLMKKSQQNSISSMFQGGGSVSTEKTMMTRAKSFLGKVCRLQEESRAVFIRILMLFSLSYTNLDEESGSGGQNQLFQMLMANIGRVVYPSYTVNRQKAVFKDRDAVIRFQTALMYELEIQTKTEKNKWAEAFDIYQHVKKIGEEICSDKEFLQWDLTLPLFLRSYTAGNIYTRIHNQGVEILQRLKKYGEAVKLLEELLAQMAYCPEYRGHWYDRLALNLDAHLKSQRKCLEVIRTGLKDPEVRPSRRYLLYQRAEKICSGPNSKYSNQLAQIEPVKVREAPEHFIEGMVMPDAGSMGMKYQFVLEGGVEGVTLCAVEELALEHYKHNGYPEGLHAEGSIISNLFLMFFWDIHFMDIPDVFHSPFQTQPFDMMTTDFYTSRKQHIDERLQWIRTTDLEDLVLEVADIWEKHNGKMCAGINWEKFSGPQKLQGLVRCMGGEVIAGILERYVKDPRHTRSGFPDLTLWNIENKTFKISEVKGPGDRLSHKQILWLDYLLSIRVDAEVCYVKAVGSKKLRPVARTSCQ